MSVGPYVVVCLEVMRLIPPLYFIGYYVLVMGLQGRPWNDCKGAEKLALRARFDTLKARKYDEGRASLDAALDKIGVIKSGA